MIEIERQSGRNKDEYLENMCVSSTSTCQVDPPIHPHSIDNYDKSSDSKHVWSASYSKGWGNDIQEPKKKYPERKHCPLCRIEAETTTTKKQYANKSLPKCWAGPLKDVYVCERVR